MTPLEKAVAAVHAVERRKGDALDVGDEGARDIVRAVLLAIREPTTDLERAGEAMDTPGHQTSAASHFTAIIDAILAEG